MLLARTGKLGTLFCLCSFVRARHLFRSTRGVGGHERPWAVCPGIKKRILALHGSSRVAIMGKGGTGSDVRGVVGVGGSVDTGGAGGRWDLA